MKKDLHYEVDVNKLYMILRQRNIKITELAKELGIKYQQLYYQFSKRKFDTCVLVAMCIVLELKLEDILIKYSEVAHYYNDDYEEEGDE